MPTLNQIRLSNAQLRPSGHELVAVFAGGTSGIGEATAKQFAKAVKKPTIWVVGRNEAAGTKILGELAYANPEGSYHFIQSDLSLLHNVDKACAEIVSVGKPIDLLFMSTGHLATSRKETSEGLEANHVLRYYARMRFVTNLQDLLLAAKAPRVVSVLGAGKEGKISEDNLDLSKSFSLGTAAAYAASMNSLATEHLSAEHPSVSFIHVFPGFVRTPLLHSSFGGILGTIGGFVTRPFSMSAEESGERNLFISTSAAYPAAKPGTYTGVPLVEGVQTVKGSTGQVGGGSYVLHYDGNDATNTSLMREFRDQGFVGKVWSHTLDTFEKVFLSGK